MLWNSDRIHLTFEGNVQLANNFEVHKHLRKQESETGPMATLIYVRKELSKTNELRLADNQHHHQEEDLQQQKQHHNTNPANNTASNKWQQREQWQQHQHHHQQQQNNNNNTITQKHQQRHPTWPDKARLNPLLASLQKPSAVIAHLLFPKETPQTDQISYYKQCHLQIHCHSPMSDTDWQWLAESSWWCNQVSTPRELGLDQEDGANIAPHPSCYDRNWLRFAAAIHSVRHGN